MSARSGSIFLDIGGDARPGSRLDAAPAPARSLAAIAADAADAPRDAPWLLAGGEPTLRADLPALLARLAALGGQPWLRTDGLALADPRAAATLQRAGLAGARVLLHSARADAHDWLAGAPGAWRRAAQAAQACRALGLPVEAEVVLARPTAPYLAETLAFAARLGARAAVVRRLEARGPAAAEFVALSPRFGLLTRPLEEADALALPWTLHGLPRCAFPALAARIAAAPALPSPPPASLCAGCPGREHCPGIPDEYTAQFGPAELWRLSPAPPRESLKIIVTAEESTRSLRQRLAHAGRLAPRRLRLVGAGARPEALDLLRESLRLSIPAVEAAGPLDGLREQPDKALFRLRDLSRVDLALHSPDAATHDARVGQPGAFAADLALLARLDGPRVGAYGVLSDPADLPGYAAGWANGRLPGEPAFRLADRGGSLAALAAAARALPALQPALAALLPPCLLPSAAAPSPPPPEDWPGERRSSPLDRVGAFAPCPRRARCAAATRCPGLAAGWDAKGIEPLPGGVE